MESPLSIKESTTKILLGYVQREYDERASDWATLERKAQGVIAVSAIFLTGIVLSFKLIISMSAIFYFVFPLLLLIVSVATAVSSMNLIMFKGIEDSERVLREADRLFSECDNGYCEQDTSALNEAEKKCELEKSRESHMRLIGKFIEFVDDRAARWMKASKDVEKINASKVTKLKLSYNLLLVSIYSITFIIIFLVVSNYSSWNNLTFDSNDSKEISCLCNKSNLNSSCNTVKKITSKKTRKPCK